MITSGLPLGCASFDHSLKFVFRTSFICLFALYSTHLYGPVPGGGIWTSLFGVPVGRMNANGTASLSRNSGSPFVRWNVTVPFASSTTTPWLRLQVFGLEPILKSRSKVYLTSLAFSSLPSENLMPLRSVNVYVLPPSVGLGTDVARSGTSFVPPVPLARLKPTRPSWVMTRSCHSCRV